MQKWGKGRPQVPFSLNIPELREKAGSQQVQLNQFPFESQVNACLDFSVDHPFF